MEYKHDIELLQMKYILTFIFIFYHISASTETGKHTADSLLQLLDHAKGSKKIKVLIELSQQLRDQFPDSSLNFALRAYEAGKSTGTDSLAAISTYQAGKGYMFTSNYHLSVSFFEKALKTYTRLNHQEKIADCYNNLGINHEYLGDYKQALEYYLEALKIREKAGDSLSIAESFINIGLVHYWLGNYDKAEEFETRAYKYFLQTGNKDRLALASNNLAMVYYSQDDFITSAQYFEKSLELMQSIGNLEGMFRAHVNLGETYKQAGIMEKSFEHLQQALKLAKKQKIKLHEVLVMFNLGAFYLETGNVDKSKTMLYNALYLAREINAAEYEKSLLLTVSEYHKTTKQFDSSLHYYQLYHQLSDSLVNEEKNEQIARLETEYDVLKKDETIQRQKWLIKRKNMIILFISITLVLLIAGMAVILRLYSQKRQAYNDLFRKNIELLKKDSHQSGRTMAKQGVDVGSSLDIQDDKMADLFIRIKEIMSEQKLYLDSQITVPKIASKLYVNEKYVSVAINQSTGNNFNHFINKLRIDEAKTVMLDEPYLTLEAVANKSGFNTKSSFNKFFKMYTGLTPSYYRLQSAKEKLYLKS